MNEPVSLVLYLIVCAAPPAQHTTEVLSHLQAAGWDVCVIATPQASPDKLTQIREEDSEPQDERLVRWFGCTTILSIRSAIPGDHRSCG